MPGMLRTLVGRSDGVAWGLLLATVALGGCTIKSVSPVVAKAEREFDAGLVGSWQAPGGKESAVVTADSGDYLVVYTDDRGKVGRFHGRLGRLGAYRVLDMWAEEPKLDASDSYKGLLLPLHTFLVIDSLGAEVRFMAVSPDSLDAHLKREPGAVAHVRLDGTVLTAPTAELRRFMAAFAARPGVLRDTTVWARR